MGQMAFSSDWPGAKIPDFVRDLSTVAIAVISRDGGLCDGNRGFFDLLPDGMTARDFLDVRDLFVNPRFDRFAARRPGSDGVLYRGILNIGVPQARVYSLQGVLYPCEDDIFLVAEHEVAGLELLRAKILQLNDELIEEQRRLSGALRSLAAVKGVANDREESRPTSD